MGAYTCRTLSWLSLTAYCFPSSLVSYEGSILYERRNVKRKGRRDAPPFSLCNYRLLDLIQMPCFCALAISSSRNMGCAMEMSFSARSQVEQPTKFTPPYSVTM